MPFTPPAAGPIFAAPDIGTIITLAIILISFIGWIINLVSEKAKQPPRRPEVNANPQRGGDDRFQQEIDKFLQQVGGIRKAQGLGVGAQRAIARDLEMLDLLRHADEERVAHVGVGFGPEQLHGFGDHPGQAA